MSVSSFITSSPPAPIGAPSLDMPSKSSGASIMLIGMEPPMAPPKWMALGALPSGTPPPMTNTIVRSGVPIGTSTTPLLTTWPESDTSLVPLLFSEPMLVYQSAPRLMISGTLVQVSTLLRLLGLFQMPLTDVRMYLGRGSGALPSMERMRALDSPETKMPTSKCNSTSKSKPVPRMFLPRSEEHTSELQSQSNL